MNVKTIIRNGKSIVYSNYGGLNAAEMLSQIKYETDYIMKQGGKVLYLCNLENSVIHPDFMRKANEVGKITKPKIERSALVGIKGMKAMLLNTFNLITGINGRAFSSEEDAVKYLTK